MQNNSGIFPAGRAVLVKPVETKEEDGLIQLPDSVKDRQRTLEDRAQVIAVGPTAWHDEPQPRAHPGDYVIIAKFAGYMAMGPEDDEPYRVINDRDIFALITAPKTEG